MRPTDEEIEQQAFKWDHSIQNKEDFNLGAKWARDFDPWHYTEDEDFPKVYENENGMIRSNYVWVKCADGEYDEASLRKDSNQNMFWDFLDEHEINGDLTDIAVDLYKVKCWMYPIEPKR